jgi:lipopolysaccharide/colanic/teichoic acid biosynthesis glycosyltransferase
LTNTEDSLCSYLNKPEWRVNIEYALRRVIDILVSAFGLLFLAPFFAIIAVMIKRDSPGPVFYKGKRVGKNGKEFWIIKFRTMYEAPESYSGRRLTIKSDPRITEFGRWLRETKINELPQLWNVLVGDMSLVGPRPEDPTLISQSPEDMARKILLVRPGMTSPASIMFIDEEEKIRTEDPIQDYIQNILPFKLKMDLDYIRNRTIINDLDLIFLTLISLIPNVRKKAINEQILYKGPIISLLRGFIKWFLIDLVVALVSSSLSILIWRLSSPINLGFIPALLLAVLMALSFSTMNAILGLNRVSWRYTRAEASIDIGITTIISLSIIIVLNFFHFFPVTIPLIIIVLSGVFSFFGFVLTRYRERIITGIASRWLSLRKKENIVGEKALIIGAGNLGLRASWFINHGNLSRLISVVGFLDDDYYKSGMVFDGSPVIGRIVELPRILKENQIDTVVIAISDLDENRIGLIESVCDENDVKYIQFEDFIKSIRYFMIPKIIEDETYKNNNEVLNLISTLENLISKGHVEEAKSLLQKAYKYFQTEEEGAQAHGSKLEK